MADQLVFDWRGVRRKKRICPNITIFPHRLRHSVDYGDEEGRIAAVLNTVNFDIHGFALKLLIGHKRCGQISFSLRSFPVVCYNRQSTKLVILGRQTSRTFIILIRFVSADTLIPPGVQGLDRYAYVNNNPLRYTDPSGHAADCSQVPDGYARQQCAKANYNQELWNNPEMFDQVFGITFTGEWREDHPMAVRRAVWAVGYAFSQYTGTSPSEAFRQVYDGGMTFQWGNCPECNGGGGYTYSARRIAFASLSELSMQRRVNNVIHELGHAFDWAVARKVGRESMPRSVLDDYWKTHPFPRRASEYSLTDKAYYGLAGPRNERVWHQNPSGEPGEEFADTFLAWVMQAWERRNRTFSSEARQRMDFIYPYMATWLGLFE